MAWKKASEELKALFDRALPGHAELERRQMFGYPAAFVNGNMMAGLHEERMVLRLSDEDRAALPGAKPFEPMKGRPMREYVVVPPALLAELPALRGWTEKAFRYAASLAPKAKKPAKRAAKKTSKKPAKKTSK
ncbi:MAG TPA: TfoX/Sxy family protein [Polyangia bacterium]|nr:TfoX/Sxy family protein [Polyangia bacterium]